MTREEKETICACALCPLCHFTGGGRRDKEGPHIHRHAHTHIYAYITYMKSNRLPFFRDKHKLFSLHDNAGKESHNRSPPNILHLYSNVGCVCMCVPCMCVREDVKQCMESMCVCVCVHLCMFIYQNIYSPRGLGIWHV